MRKNRTRTGGNARAFSILLATGLLATLKLKAEPPLTHADQKRKRSELYPRGNQKKQAAHEAKAQTTRPLHVFRSD